MYKDMVYVDRNGRKLAVVCSQSGGYEDAPTIFFVHGSMARLGQFREIIKNCQGLGWRTVSYDLYGCGRSEKPVGGDYSTAAHLKDLEFIYKRYSDKTGSQPNFLVAHSFGCSLALSHALRSSSAKHMAGTLRGILLLGPAHPNSKQMKSRRRLFSLPTWLLRCMGGILSRGFKERAFSSQTLDRSAEQAKDTTRKRALAYAESTSGANKMHVVREFYSRCNWVTDDELAQFGFAPVTSPIALTAAAELAEKGFSVLPNMIDPAWLAQLRERFETLSSDEG